MVRSMTSVIVMVRRTTLGIVMSGECVWWSSCANAAPTKKGAEDGVAGDESGMAEVTRMIGNAGTASEIELRVEDRAEACSAGASPLCRRTNEGNWLNPSQAVDVCVSFDPLNQVVPGPRPVNSRA